jgi:hypothetical protein
MAEILPVRHPEITYPKTKSSQGMLVLIEKAERRDKDLLPRTILSEVIRINKINTAFLNFFGIRETEKYSKL